MDESLPIQAATDHLDDLGLDVVELLVRDRQAAEDPLREHLLDEPVEGLRGEGRVDLGAEPTATGMSRAATMRTPACVV